MIKLKVRKAAAKFTNKRTVHKRVKSLPAKTHRTTRNKAAKSPSAVAKTELKTRNGHAGNGHAKLQLSPASEGNSSIGPVKTHSGVDLTEKIKELIRLAQEQGHLSYDDINDALPDNIVTPEDLDEIYTKLRNLDIEIVDQAVRGRAQESSPVSAT